MGQKVHPLGFRIGVSNVFPNLSLMIKFLYIFIN
jgi:hypothetical protein